MNEEMNNREQSGHLLARLISRLSENGVVPERITGRELFDSDPTNEQMELLHHLVNWLENEGIIWHPGTRFKQTYNLVLTAAGFRQLENKFTGDLTLGAAITRAAKNEPMTAGFGDFFGGILGGFTKSIGS